MASEVEESILVSGAIQQYTLGAGETSRQAP
jgi:hypothetical protein